MTMPFIGESLDSIFNIKKSSLRPHQNYFTDKKSFLQVDVASLVFLGLLLSLPTLQCMHNKTITKFSFRKTARIIKP